MQLSRGAGDFDLYGRFAEPNHVCCRSALGRDLLFAVVTWASAKWIRWTPGLHAEVLAFVDSHTPLAVHVCPARRLARMPSADFGLEGFMRLQRHEPHTEVGD